MTEHDGIDYEWDATVTRVYREVVAEADPQQGTTTKEAFAVAAERLAEMVANGELFIDPAQAIRAALSRADRGQGRAADAIIKRLATGQEAFGFDGDPMLDTVVTLGDGKRKSWRHVTAEDLRDMDRLRYQNYRQQAIAYDEWRENYDQVLPAVAQHGTVGNAHALGAFEVSDIAA